MPKPEHHIFVCMQSRPAGHPRGSCGVQGSQSVFNRFSEELIKRNLQAVSLTQAGCIGPCQAGANVLIYPAGTMYAWVEPDDVDKIIDQHIIAGKPYLEKQAPKELW